MRRATVRRARRALRRATEGGWRPNEEYDCERIKLFERAPLGTIIRRVLWRAPPGATGAVGCDEMVEAVLNSPAVFRWAIARHPLCDGGCREQLVDTADRGGRLAYAWAIIDGRRLGDEASVWDDLLSFGAEASFVRRLAVATAPIFARIVTESSFSGELLRETPAGRYVARRAVAGPAGTAS
jgi:hypothetical protein